MIKHIEELLTELGPGKFQVKKNNGAFVMWSRSNTYLNRIYDGSERLILISGDVSSFQSLTRLWLSSEGNPLLLLLKRMRVKRQLTRTRK